MPSCEPIDGQTQNKSVARKLETITGVFCFTLSASAPPIVAEEIASETWEQFFAGASEM